MGLNEILFFTGFLCFIFLMLAIDLGVFSKKKHIVSFKEAAIWSGVWVSLAICLYFVILYHGHHIHGIDSYERLLEVANLYLDDKDSVVFNPKNFEESLHSYRQNMALEFITGYLIEYSLSVDNIFVIILIFTSFSVPEKYYKTVLLWGILGAVVMRFIFIFLGSALVQSFDWVIYIFGAFLLFSGVKMLFDNDEESINTESHPVVRLVSRYFAVFPRYVGENFFIMRNGRFMLTPLFVVVLIIEFTDLIFAVDSIPAVFSVTIDPYIVFFSNIFAIMGLRSMFFFLARVMHLFRFLKVGLSFLLVFIGFKMIFHSWLFSIGFKSHYSLFVILGILTVSIVLSLVFPKKDEEQNKILPDESNN
ncbi:MAG: TerC family protein [Bernardetiaceae bacterium]|nr:TerC family protein [Bernardetiaceae bacterium]